MIITHYDLFLAEYMFIVGGNGGTCSCPFIGTEIVSLREDDQIPDCLTDLSDPYPTPLLLSSAGGALPDAGKKSFNTYP